MPFGSFDRTVWKRIFSRHIGECQTFFLTYQDRISETVFREFAVEKSEMVVSIFEINCIYLIRKNYRRNLRNG